MMSSKTYALSLRILLLQFFLYKIGCDWIEISQNHYRKEPLHKVAINFDHATNVNKTYNNLSMPERQWTRGVVDKISNAGNIRRVQLPNTKTTSKINGGMYNFDYTETPKAEYNFIAVKPNLNVQDYDVSKSENEFKKNVIQTTNGNADYTKALQPNYKITKKLVKTSAPNNFIKANPEITTETETLKVDKKPQVNALFTNPNEKFDNNEFSENTNIYSIHKSNIRRVSHNNYVYPITSTHSQNKHYHLNNTDQQNSLKIKLTQRGDNFDTIEDNVKENNVNPNKKQITTKTEGMINNYFDETDHNTYKTITRPYKDPDSTDKFPISVGYKQTDYNIKNLNENEDVPIKTYTKPNTDIPGPNYTEDLTQSMKDKQNSFSGPDGVSNTTKGTTINGILKIIRVVADTIYKNTHRSFKSKVKYLENLKSTILDSIEEHIDQAWPDDVQRVGSSRRARSAQARGHVEFPSSESTLMTISFLTFAVFLIKLVLQVIHTYKNKTMMVTPTLVAAVGRAAAALKSHK